MKRTILSAVAGAGLSAATMATAQSEPPVDAVFTFGYSFGELSVAGLNADVNTISSRFASTIRPGENIEFDLDVDLRSIDVDNFPVDAQVGYFAVEPRYRLPNGLILLGFYEYSNTNLSPAVLGNLEPQTDTYGFGIGYEGANWEAEAFYSQSDLDPITVFTPLDIHGMGLRGSVDVNDRFTIGGHFLRQVFDVNVGPQVDAYSVGAAFFYDVSERFTVYGGLSHQWADEFGFKVERTAPSIGVSYTSGGTRGILPVTWSVEYAASNLSTSPGPLSPDFTEFRFGLTIPLGGNQNLGRPLNSDAYHIIDGSHDMLSAIGNF